MRIIVRGKLDINLCLVILVLWATILVVASGVICAR